MSRTRDLIKEMIKNQKHEESLPPGWKNLTYEREDPEKKNQKTKRMKEQKSMMGILGCRKEIIEDGQTTS